MLLEKINERLARVPDAARHFNIPMTRMYQLIHDGEVPAAEIGVSAASGSTFAKAEQSLKDNRRVV